MTPRPPRIILLAEDDADDRKLTADALDEGRVGGDVRWVGDGHELLEYLHREGRYADPASAPRPGLILLDLNMPRMGGHEALQAIKSDPELRCIPVVVLSTSRSDDDVLATYELGASSFITKPMRFEDLVEALRLMGRYWLELVELPPHRTSA